jgi:hypothetical protein
MALVAGIFCGALILLGVPPELNALVQLKNDDQLALLSNQSLTFDGLNSTDFEDVSNGTVKR